MRNYKLWISSIFLLFLLIIVFAGPSLPFVDSKLKQNGAIKTEEGKFYLPPFPPMEGYPLGSNHEGVDILSLLVMGAKETLSIVIMVVLIRYLLAIPLAVGGFYSKWLEKILQAWQQLFSFMPPIFFVSFFVTLPFIFFAPDRGFRVIVILAVLETGRVAEIILQHMKETRRRPYIEAGIAAGGSPFKMFKNYYFPAVIPHIIILIINDMGRVLFLIAQLGVVHIYVTHKFMTVESGAYEVVNTSLAWPTMFSTITKDIFTYEWIPFSVIGAIALTIFIFNMFADGMQRFFERKYRTFRSDL
ncbi:ABC transporter permease subunit [Neobacillus sp. PS2-9]|uniref:ABC transporter permease subunit n=1 Tax=Neobacillus sp. PS2-9 TaxID=3070676 RepID=UPI0027E1E156|nr:ABC transporter permease subunit [Neobacillus sp. PS2-9]WML59099.1 ABC transporter permease subunit [Neobacillus sp. PS2-9]